MGTCCPCAQVSACGDGYPRIQSEIWNSFGGLPQRVWRVHVCESLYSHWTSSIADRFTCTPFLPPSSLPLSSLPLSLPPSLPLSPLNHSLTHSLTHTLTHSQREIQKQHTAVCDIMAVASSVSLQTHIHVHVVRPESNMYYVLCNL